MCKFCLPKSFFIAALLLALCATARSSAPSDLQNTFPYQFGRWVATNSPIKVKPTEQEWTLLLEAGLQGWFGRPYSDGSQSVIVNLKQFRDPSGAYQAYTAAITPEMHPSTVGPLTAIGPDRFLMLIGNVLVEVEKPQLPSTEELQELAGLIRKFADPAPLPPIRTYLPEGFADGTQRYTLGPAGFQAALESLHRNEYSRLAPEAGFSSGAEAMLARYHSGKEDAVLLLIEYPTPQLAELHLRHLQITMPESDPVAKTPIERKGSLLVIALSPSSAAYAESLRNAVNYETQVTWNEPTHTLTDPPWTSVIAKIFIGTGVFMVAAFVLGIAFGGVRVVTKRLFPGKVFDRPERMEILQLGLSGKRIDPSDFY